MRSNFILYIDKFRQSSNTLIMTWNIKETLKNFPDIKKIIGVNGVS